MEGQPLRIRCAGVCSVGTLDGQWERNIPTSQGRLVFARLALARGPIGRDELAELLWPEETPGAWERHLSAVVSKLRHMLADAPQEARASIAGGSGTYELRLPRNSVIDVVEAEAAVQRAWIALADNRLNQAVTMAMEAADVVRRPFLPGTDALWADEQRNGLRGVRLRALEVIVEVAIRRRDAGGVAAASEAIVVDPYRETGYRNLMRLHLANGERSAAVEVYKRCRSTLSDELGIDTSPALQNLLQTALDGSADVEPSAEPSAPRGGRPHPGTLLVPATSFVGRDDALAAVAAALRRSRLVTLTGTGGVGKSRLALEAAHRLARDQRDGVRLCELAHVVDASSVVHALAAALGVQQSPGSTIEDTLVTALTSRHLLLVADNCEHVLDALVPLLERILGQCPHIHILATSRERLAAHGESLMALDPLDVPESEADPAAEWERPTPALELLRDRIRSVRGDYRPGELERAALVELCRRLDGLPLALELAAPRVAAMGAVEVARRLDRRFALLTRGWRTALPRHRTLQAAVEWSYDLLDEAERRVFERASVFVGGFTLESVERISSSTGEIVGADVADVVAALVEKSMLVVDDNPPATRYRMLETLRQFGQERLRLRGESAATEEAHALHYMELAREAEPQLRGPAETEWVPILDAELGNFRAVYAWALRSGRPEVAIELLAALYFYAHWRTHSEVHAWAAEVTGDASISGPHLARALAVAGDGAWKAGDLIRAKTLGERAVAAAGLESDARFGRSTLGAVAMFEGRLHDSIAAMREAAALAGEEDDHYHATDALGSVAIAQYYSGETSAAVATARACGDEALRSGSPSALAWSAYASGEVATATDPQGALAALDRSVELADTVGAHFVRGVALLSATTLRARRGDPTTAVDALVRIIDLWERAGNWRQQWVTLRAAAELLVRLGRDEAAAVVLGSIDARDAANVYGADAERLSVLRAGLKKRLGRTADVSMTKGRGMDPVEVIAFTRRQLGEHR